MTTGDELPRHEGQDRNALATRLLSETGTLAAESLDYQGTIDQVARLAVPAFADWCLTLTCSGDARMTVAHGHPGMESCGRELFRRRPLRLDPERGIGKVLRTGKSDLLHQLPDALLRAIAMNENHLALLRRMGFRSAIAVAMRARGRTVGAMAFVTTTSSGRRLEEADLLLAEEIGRRSGLAVDNALLYQEAKLAIRAREDMVASATHDLRAPVTTLKVQVHNFRHKAGQMACNHPEFPELLEGLGRIEDQLERLRVLLDYFLDLSHLMGGEMLLRLEDLDASTLVRECALRSQGALDEAGCKLTIHADRPCVGHWDRIRVEQVVNNLLSNAVKFGRGKPIDVDCEGDAEVVRVTVRDQGIGVSQEAVKTLFERFHRSREAAAFPGSGLGLYIVKNIVEALGGTVSVESPPGTGARFTVELPRSGPKKGKGPPPAPEGTPPP